MEFVKKLEKILFYFLIEINCKKNELIDRGVDIINFGVGDLD